MRLQTIDVNLLVVLDTLLEEQSVSRAAARLGLSQSATSHALSRLRDLLGDDLLVRTGASMTITPRADALKDDLHGALASLSAAVFGGQPFDPSQATTRFAIACEGYFAATVLPKLVRRCRSAAPGVTLDIVELGSSVFDRVCTHRVDLAAGVPASESPPETVSEELFEEDIVCVLADSGDAAQRLSLRHFAELEHVVVGMGAPGPTRIDRELAKHGLRRTIAARVPHFLAAPFVAVETGAVFTCPRRLARRFQGLPGVVLAEPPEEVAFSFRYLQVWHRRVGGFPPHRWLRQQVSLASAEADSRSPP